MTFKRDRTFINGISQLLCLAFIQANEVLKAIDKLYTDISGMLVYIAEFFDKKICTSYNSKERENGYFTEIYIDIKELRTISTLEDRYNSFQLTVDKWSPNLFSLLNEIHEEMFDMSDMTLR